MLGNKLFPVFTVGMLGMFGAILVANNAGTVEGRLFPVMGPLEIFDPSQPPDDEAGIKWRGRAEKLRGCNYVGTEWYLGPRNGRRVQVAFRYTDKPQVRDAGFLEWDGMIVALSRSDTINNSHADVLHKCPWRPWVTRTRFYN